VAHETSSTGAGGCDPVAVARDKADFLLTFHGQHSQSTVCGIQTLFSSLLNISVKCHQNRSL